MGINLQKIKKWTKMLAGNSSYHVNQVEGRVYSKDEIRGYYNDLTEKVSRFGLPGDQIPVTTVDSGEKLYFPIAIFQYGLAAYDLFLLNVGDAIEMRSRVVACANWAIDNQQNDGSWITFAYENPNHPYSSMAQAEAISLLLRAYQIEKKEKYIEAVKKSTEFMLIPIEDGGTTSYQDGDVFLYECTHDPLILNGWIFSIWGLMDYCKFFDDSNVQNILTRTIQTLEKKLQDFDLGYWSKYEDGKRICSPFYHKLHIAQLNVMYELTGHEIYKKYAGLWGKYQQNRINRCRAFITKACQKVFE